MAMETPQEIEPVLVACPDARPPAYQAVVGLSRAGLLGQFVTASYYDPDGLLASWARRFDPDRLARLERFLLRRHDPEIPPDRVRAHPGYDLAVRLESVLATKRPRLRRAVARWRTERFDAQLARTVERTRPGALLVFSDVGSAQALPTSRRLGIPTILSMVHGDVREEQRVLKEEAEASPEFLPLYLGKGLLDRDELTWLHERRLRDLALVDRVVVPSDHIAETLEQHGTPRARIRVIPYAADCRRFRPLGDRRDESSCSFLFAGGISQRKGIKYLLQAWQRIRRPGWRLQLLGPLPGDTAPLWPYLETVELLGRVGHAEMPARMAEADVFVFPSLFEGSAVVTFEALASGLPSVVTPNAGSVVRDGVEGFVIPPRDVDALAARMEQIGNDPALRAEMAAAARARALAFAWPRYHAAWVDLVQEIRGRGTGPTPPRYPVPRLTGARSGSTD
jgi:glycosyltransferase involved in cell wall biosynthesis